MTQIELGEITVDVILKDIKNIHLSVYPPTGRVRISAPNRMSLDTIRVYAISRLDWIKKQQDRFQNQEREPQRAFVTRESHCYLGKRYLLKITESDSPSTVILGHSQIELVVKPNSTVSQRGKLLDEWYRRQLRNVVAPYVEKWATAMDVNPEAFEIKKMRTKWGSCNREAKRIWLNLELAKKPSECIEYIVVHELAHLLERSHNQRFAGHMDRLLPNWRQLKDRLNRLPISHSDWDY